MEWNCCVQVHNRTKMFSKRFKYLPHSASALFTATDLVCYTSNRTHYSLIELVFPPTKHTAQPKWWKKERQNYEKKYIRTWNCVYELNIEQLELASHNTALQRAQIPWIKTDSVVSCVLLFALVGIKLVLSLTHTRRYQRRNEWNEQNTTHIHLTSHSNHLPYTLHTFFSLLFLLSFGVWCFLPYIQLNTVVLSNVCIFFIVEIVSFYTVHWSHVVFLLHVCLCDCFSIIFVYFSPISV